MNKLAEKRKKGAEEKRAMIMIAAVMYIIQQMNEKNTSGLQMILEKLAEQ